VRHDGTDDMRDLMAANGHERGCSRTQQRPSQVVGGYAYCPECARMIEDPSVPAPEPRAGLRLGLFATASVSGSDDADDAEGDVDEAA
jgi:hypothetical protein